MDAHGNRMTTPFVVAEHLPHVELHDEITIQGNERRARTLGQERERSARAKRPGFSQILDLATEARPVSEMRL